MPVVSNTSPLNYLVLILERSKFCPPFITSSDNQRKAWA